MMAAQKLTDYERRRLENIKRNEEMLAALNIHSTKASLLLPKPSSSSNSKRPRALNKSYKTSPNKKPKDEAPLVIRRSLRSRGIAPDSETAGGLQHHFNDQNLAKSQFLSKVLIRERGPLSMRDAFIGGKGVDYSKMAEHISEKKKGNEGFGGMEAKSRDLDGGVDLHSLRLEPENVARVVPGRIMTVKMYPCEDMRMVVVGNKFGNVGFWNVEEEDGNGIYMYQPHSGPVSGFLIPPFDISKMFSCGYDGSIRLMDVDKEMFDLAYASDDSIFSISQRPNDIKSLYFAEGQGGVHIWDERTGKSSSSWALHDSRINSIDFSSCNTNLMATGSTDGTACIWDLRKVVSDRPEALTTISHKRAVYSAYFSPSGSLLATTSIDDTIGILHGTNYDNISMVHHNNQTGKSIYSFRGIWGWDDSYIFIGNMRRGVDVISTAENRCVTTLQSPEMSAIPCRFDVHPSKVGMLAGATSGGQVYLWTSS